jgi:hypothetical protein
VGVDAEPLHHRLDGLLGERRVLERVTGVVEADHQAVADQQVVADALDLDDVLDPRAGKRGADGKRTEENRQGGEAERLKQRGPLGRQGRLCEKLARALVTKPQSKQGYLIGGRGAASGLGRICPALTMPQADG